MLIFNHDTVMILKVQTIQNFLLYSSSQTEGKKSEILAIAGSPAKYMFVLLLLS